MKKEDLQSIIEEVPEGKEFRLSDGNIIKSIPELYISLQKMPPKVFASHVTDDRNDFADWIRGVQQDYKLSEALHPSMNKQACLFAVADRLYQIEKAMETKKEIKSIESNTGLLEIAARITHNVNRALPKGPLISYPEFAPLVSYPDFPSKKISPDEKVMDILSPEQEELILEQGGDDLVEAAESATPRKKIQKEISDFTSDMKKVFTIRSKKKQKKMKIDNLKKVLSDGQEE